MTTIEYNGINPFLGLAPTPLISHSASMIRYGTRWGELDTYTLHGQITGDCNDTIADYVDKQQELLNNFSLDFQTLQIFDDSTGVLTRDFVKINKISFADSTYAQQLLPFDIEIECYPQNYFSGSFGVLEPKSEISYEESDQGVVSITQTVSAKGFPTNSSANNAFENAQSWVASQTGFSSQVLPEFIFFNDNVCLRGISCRADRINGTYEATLKYNSDSFDTQAGILRYTTEVSLAAEVGITNVSVKGQLDGCLAQDISSVRARFQGFNIFSEAVSQYQKFSGNTNLNSVPLTSSIGEDPTHKIITFEKTFTDDPRPPISVDLIFNFDYDFEQDVISANSQATIRAHGPYTSTTWVQVKAVAAAIDLFSLTVPAYTEYVNLIAPALASYPLNPNPTNTSRQENEFSSQIVLSATFTNAIIPPAGFDKFDYTLAFSPAIRQYAPYPILDQNGQYYIFDLGFIKRGTLAIEIKAHLDEITSLSAGLSLLKSQALSIQNNYLDGTKKVLENQSFSENKVDERNISASASYGSEQAEFTIS